MPEAPPEPSIEPPSGPSADPPRLLDRPRLADLFVFSFMLSVFLAFCRYAFACELNFAIWPLNDWETVGYGLGVACCWTGIYRMLRPGGGRGPLRPGEWQPGEMICVVEGLYYLVVAGIGTLLRLWLLGGQPTISEDDPKFGEFSHAQIAGLYLVPAIAMAIGYGVMALWFTVPVWRWGAIGKAAGHLLSATLLLLFCGELLIDFGDAPTIVLLLCFLVPTVMVLAAAIYDRRRPGVHWLHWLGIFAFAVIYASRLSLELRVWLEPVE